MQQESLAGALLVTKLYLPPARPNLVARPDLTARLAAAIAGPLTVVSAPAGFGKTTLISAWRDSPAAADHAVGWLSLDPDDNDPLRFLQYLAAAIDMAEPGAAAQALGLLRLPRTPNPKDILSALLNGLVAARGGAIGVRPVVLVLDDYHVLQNQAVHEAVGYLLDHLPPCLHVVILSRIDPPLALARLRVRGQLTELRAGDLRFTAEEAAAFLNGAMGLRLSAEDVQALEARTEGWIAALQLAAICLGQADAGRGHSRAARFIEEFGASNRYVAEYLMDEVLSRQAPHVQDFLLRTSILERMCGPLCEAVLSESVAEGATIGDGVSSAQQVLADVDRGNLFVVPLDDQGYWYRYHHLFRDFLRGRLASKARGTPQALTALHLRASGWYEANGYLNEAVRHAVQSGEMTRAADLVEKYANPMLCRSEVKTLQGWYALLPDELIRRRPMLAVYHAWALNLLPSAGSHELILQRLEQAKAAAEQALVSEGDEALVRLVAGHAATIQVYFLEHAARTAEDYRAVLDLAETAEELLPDSELTVHGANQYNMGRAYTGLADLERADAAFEASRRLGLRVSNDYVAASSFYYRGRIAYLQGRLRAAAEMLRAGLAGREWFPPREITRLPALGAAYVALGCILLEWNDLDEAEEYLRRGLDGLQYAGVHGAVEAGHAALARLCRMRGDMAGVDAAVERLSRVAPAGELYAGAVRAARWFGQSPSEPPAFLVDWARQAAGAGTAGIFGANAWGDARYLDFLTRARVEIAAGAPLSVIAPLQARVEEAEAHGMMLRAVELRVVQAQAFNALGENKRAFESLRRALELAEPEGMVRVFDGGPAVERLLAEAADRGLAPIYADRILAALGSGQPRLGGAVATDSPSPGLIEAPTPLVATSAMRPETLTEREQEILELIAQGLSNADVAARLYVEVSTVKRHMNHILGKLGAANRTQAVARARATGLLG